ncbi:MAG: hypothetical protein LBT23_10720 [Synergistaceae bacterium]|jgi:hypothetical protein|nr:hypothetical protein [Synergistaceae bacterium]
MSEDKTNLSSDKKEERGPLSKVLDLAPLLSLVIQALEFALKLAGIIK